MMIQYSIYNSLFKHHISSFLFFEIISRIQVFLLHDVPNWLFSWDGLNQRDDLKNKPGEHMLG